jgi:midasin (ATPase involved in ribosome maturation)
MQRIFMVFKELLGSKIIKIIDNIGPEKLVTVVSDNVPDIRIAQRILYEKYPYILNIQCMIHCINLIIKDLCKHTFVKNIIQKISVIHQYFTISYVSCQFLKNAIKFLQIKGEGLKNHSTKTC